MNDLILVFADSAGNEHTVSLIDLINDGLPIEPEHGDDLTFIGCKLPPIGIEVSGGIVTDVRVNDKSAEFFLKDHDDFKAMGEEEIASYHAVASVALERSEINRAFYEWLIVGVPASNQAALAAAIADLRQQER